MTQIKSITELTVENFRCFESGRWEFPGDTICIIGNNATGKTSLLEAIYFLGRTRSFRASDNASLAQNRGGHFQIVAKLREDEESNPMPLGLRWEQQTALTVRANGEALKGRSALANLLPVHLIGPEPQRLITDGPSVRRAWLDWGVFHVEPKFQSCFQRYRKLLKSRNAALENQDRKTTAAVEKSLAAEGELLTALRTEYLNSAQQPIQTLANEAFNLPELELNYQRGWAKDFDFKEALERSRDRDIRYGNTSVGPHRAEITIKGGGDNVAQFGSRGQQKLWSIAMMLGQYRFHVEHTGIGYPVLVDDLTSELDENHAKAAASVLANLPAQRFVTSVDEAVIDWFESPTVFHVERN